MTRLYTGIGELEFGKTVFGETRINRRNGDFGETFISDAFMGETLFSKAAFGEK